MWIGHNMGWGWTLFGGAMMLLFWAGLIVFVVWLVRSVFPGSASSSTPTADADLSARQILDRRYASGEITRDQYEDMKRDLSG